MARTMEVLRGVKILGLMVLIAGFTACVTQTSRPLPPPAQPETRVFVYPLQGQSADLQDRDRYECHKWAVQESGFDPSAPYVPPHLRVVVASGPPPGTGIVTGAMAGAVIGSILSRPWESGRGALLGALAGAAVGGIAESSAAREAQEEAQSNAEYARAAALEEQARFYVRALSACLSARGYEVR